MITPPRRRSLAVKLAWVLLVLGVASIVVATLVLTRESAVSLRIVEAHVREIESRRDA